MENKCKILIYGAGVIGSIYGVKFSNAGHDVAVYARGNRLQTLERKGLLYNENDLTKKAQVRILNKLSSDDVFDYIFVTVRYEQIENALIELKNNNSQNIVTMVNNPKGYSIWENILGKNRLIPAFAGAGGKIDDDILHYQLTSKIIQPTTFGEIGGKQTDRIKKLSKIFKDSKIPHSISKNMDAWQKSQLAMVIPLANGIYFDGGDNYTTAKNKEAVRFMSSSLKKNFNDLRRIGIAIIPSKLNIFRICPVWILDVALRFLYNTKFAEELINNHAQIAKNEMKLLEKEYNEFIHNH
jgi:2-dehydropantoate 2-reductase